MRKSNNSFHFLSISIYFRQFSSKFPHYVKTWFMDNYANYYEQPVFDEDGFVVVKTKAEMDAENTPQVPEEEKIAC